MRRPDSPGRLIGRLRFSIVGLIHVKAVRAAAIDHDASSSTGLL